MYTFFADEMRVARSQVRKGEGTMSEQDVSDSVREMSVKREPLMTQAHCGTIFLFYS